MDTTLVSRVPIVALSDIETFLTSAQHLKALTVQLAERQARESGLQNSLARQIAKSTQQCTELAAKSARLGELWRQVQAELRSLNMSNGGR